LPAIKTAKKLGYNVVSVDNIPQNIGHKYSDSSENVSTLNLLEVLDVAKKHAIDGIITIASDVALPTVSFVADQLKLQALPLNLAERISSKTKFRSFLKNNKLLVPEYCEATTLAEAEIFFNKVGHPIFIKPSDRSGSKGVAKINSLDELIQKFPAALAASIRGSVCVEKYLVGIEVGCEAFCFDGRVEILAVTNKRVTDRHVVCGHSLPCQLSLERVKQVKEMVSKVILLLGIKWGPVNLDILLTEDGPYVIDIGGRLGGNGLPQIVELSTGVNTLRLAIAVALGEKPTPPAQIKTLPAGVRVFGSEAKAVIKGFTDLRMVRSKFPEIFELVIDYAPGQTVPEFSEGKYRLGHVIVREEPGKNVNLLLDLIEKEISLQYEIN